jgi:ribosomal protein L12E/L44/L45/RPP1/RPP2
VLVFQTDLEEKLAKLEEMMAQHPAGCGAVPFAAATPAEMARAARMDEKQKEKKRLAAQLQAIEDKTEALQVCLVPCGVSFRA